MRYLLAFAAALLAMPVSAQDFAVPMTVDASTPVGQLAPIWRFFGADEPNYATMKDGRKLLTHLGALRPGEIWFRAHNLLTSGDGTPAFKWGSTNAYTEDAAGNPVYNWTISDAIIDSYRARGIHPYLEVGFMPEALSSAPPGMRYQHDWRPTVSGSSFDGGWQYPPRDYGRWEELVYRWTLHNVERYGRDEVLRWYFETWNEANLSAYWKGTPEEFYRLHDVTVAGIRRALPGARVGGPDVAGAGGTFMDGFLAHVVAQGTPTDFLAFHAKGAPTLVDGHIRMGLDAQLRTVDQGFAKIAAVPALKDKPIVIGENDPEGCAACSGPGVNYRNGTVYSSYTAASFPRLWELAARHRVNLEGALTWAFTFEDQPWFAGYRQLASNGIDLPVLNTFRLFAMLGPTQLAATSARQAPLDAILKDGVRGDPDVGVLATRTADGRIAILVWHYHDDDVAGPSAQVSIALTGLGKARVARVTQWRVDGSHGNAFAAWNAMGSPRSVNRDQYAALETASQMVPEAWAAPVAVKRGRADIAFGLPRQGVSLLIVEPR
ncbi:beta-xylosidase [Sphingomonas sp. LB-2]|uniref:GH39 family glycosyl hydrolase n=1 Tax=Sphingomonas caeni TaxID=2984949 RepID=UPI00222EC33E|nr:beta-xylosidase [Sphingomonas caeni]MCW3849057.1 beta-xylosidase [Sphingomonas caeni]